MLWIKSFRGIQQDVLARSRDHGADPDEGLRSLVDRHGRHDGGDGRTLIAITIINRDAVAVRLARRIKSGGISTARRRAVQQHLLGHHEIRRLFPRQHRRVQRLVVRGGEFNVDQAAERRARAGGRDAHVRRHNVRGETSGVEERIHAQQQRRGVGERAVIVEIQLRVKHAANAAETEAHQVAVEIFVVPKIMRQTKRRADAPQPRADHRRADARKRDALEPRERHILHQRIRPQFRHRAPVVKQRVRLVLRLIQREFFAAADRPARADGRGVRVNAEFKAAAHRAVGILHMHFGDQPPKLPRRSDRQPRAAGRVQHTLAVNVPAQKAVRLRYGEHMNHRRHAIRLRLQREGPAPETVVRHLRRKKFLILPHQPAQRRRRVRLRSAIERHDVSHTQQRVARQWCHAQRHALRRRDEIIPVKRCERHPQHMSVTHRQHGARRRRVGESPRHIRRRIQLERPQRRAKQHRRRLRPGEARQCPPANGHVDLHRLRDREIIRPVRRREHRGQNLPAPRRQHRPRRRHINKRTRHRHRRVQLYPAQNRTLLHRRRRGPVYIRQRLSHVQHHLLRHTREIRHVIRREHHPQDLTCPRIQHGAQRRIVGKRSRHIRRRIQLHPRQRRAINHVRWLRPRHHGRSLQNVQRDRLRRARKIHRVHRGEDHAQNLVRSSGEQRAGGRFIDERARGVRLRVQLQTAQRCAIKNRRGLRPRNHRTSHPHPQRTRRERR